MLALLFPEAAAATTTTRIIVKREPGLGPAERADIRADADVRYVEPLPLPRTEVVAAPRGELGEALRELNADPDVVYAEPDYVRRTMTDPAMGQLWAFENTGQQIFDSVGTEDADADVIEAWDLATGVGQTVGVVDTGVDDGHEDLAGQVLGLRTFVGTGPDVLDAALDEDGHGTHIAGTIAAVRGNGLGGAGVAPDADLLALKALASDGSGYDSDIVDAFHYAAQNGAKVVNASFAGPAGGKTLRAAIQAHPDMLFVTAAGNDDGDNDTVPQYPCNVPLANVLCVAASTNTDARMTDSNVGDRSVDLFAPGGDILSSVPPFVFEDETYRYEFTSGTSMAAPHVAGAAALVMEKAPDLDAVDVKQILMMSGDVGDDFAHSVTGRRLNAAAAVGMAVDPTVLDDDEDQDGWADAADACPTIKVLDSPDGCPLDDDWDGVLNDADNCDVDPNADQANADGDALGNACDPTPRGHNNDGDHLWQIDDTCPDVYGTLANGCPPPPPSPPPPPPPPPPPNRDGDDRVDSIDYCPTEYAITNDGCPLPQVASLSGKVRKRGKKRSVTVRVVTTRLANVRVTIERKRGKRWVRVKRRRVATVANRARVAAKRVRPGRYRVRVSISNGAGTGTPVSKRFRVR